MWGVLQGKQAEAAQASAAQLGPALVGQRVWIKWPYLQEALVCAVSDVERKVCIPEHLLTGTRPCPLDFSRCITVLLCTLNW